MAPPTKRAGEGGISGSRTHKKARTDLGKGAEASDEAMFEGVIDAILEAAGTDKGDPEEESRKEPRDEDGDDEMEDDEEVEDDSYSTITDTESEDDTDARAHKSYVRRYRRKDLVEKEYMEDMRKEELIAEFKALKKEGETFVGAKVLGEGGQGCTKLFVTVDDYQRIETRLAIKEAYPYIGAWYKQDMWHTKDRQHPREAKLQDMCSNGSAGDSAKNQPGNRNIVKCHGYEVYPSRMTFRIYMEYMSWGDMDNITKAQAKEVVFHNPHLGDEELGGDDYGLPVYRKWLRANLPEPFVWYYFKQMATACIRMKGINDEPNKEIVHQDLKPSNVFMAPPDSQSFPKYPVLKIGDFGSARLTWEKDARNPLGFSDALTRGWQPPEISVDERHDPDFDTMTISQATNVWQIGQIARCMIRFDQRPDQPRWRRMWEDGEGMCEEVPGVPEDWTYDYSDELVEVIKRCLEMWPDDQFTPEELLKEVERNKDKYEEMEGTKAMRWSNKDLWIHFQGEDKFAKSTFLRSES